MARAWSAVFGGRISRAVFVLDALAAASGFAALFLLLERAAGHGATLALYPPLYAALAVLAVRRLHDRDRSAAWLLLLLVPVLGPLWLLVGLFFARGTKGANRYGADPLAAADDYLTVAVPSAQGPLVVNDVTALNPVPVARIVAPATVAEVQAAVRGATGPISVGGGHFSMGGQTASPASLHLDMRRLCRVLALAPRDRTIRVEAGIRWCDIQRAIDPHGLSVKVMQTYANFTVGGSLSVNVHGRYVGLGPLILSVRSIALVLASGERVEASPAENAEVFYGAIGGYGGLGVIVEAELDLAENVRVAQVVARVPAAGYREHFRATVRGSEAAVFHNADLYPPTYARGRSVTWVRTDRPVTEPRRLMQPTRTHPLERYFFWAVSETPFGKWRREHVLDPLFYLRARVHWRNYEAGYDVAELEPASRDRATYVLQEYFVPWERFDAFLPKMAEILQRHDVNVINVSVRHAVADPGSVLAWARREVFAFVLYYKQGTGAADRGRVAVWTRELIEAAISEGGAYYLPYQAHARPDQFHRAFPRADDLFALKRRLDPDARFRNVIWDTYYDAPAAPEPPPGSEFRAVFARTASRDAFYRFLQVVYHLYPEDRFHHLIVEACARHDTDEAIYEDVQRALPGIKPFLADLRYALPSLAKQKREMAHQTAALLGSIPGGARVVSGYTEIGTTGRYVRALRRHVPIGGDVVLVHDVAPGSSPVDVVERGGLARVGRFVPLGDYSPIAPEAVADATMDLVTCYIGLHHADPEKLPGFVGSIARVLRPGGVFVLRDHDVDDPAMDAFVSLAHTVFNLGLGAPWEVNAREPRHFAPLARFVAVLAAAGLRDTGQRLLQANDPSANTLMAFVKEATP